jgi:hypothetical protein
VSSEKYEWGEWGDHRREEASFYHKEWETF